MLFRHRLVNLTYAAWIALILVLPDLLGGSWVPAPWLKAAVFFGAAGSLAAVLGTDALLYARGQFRNPDAEAQAALLLAEAERRKPIDPASAAGGFRMLIRHYAHTDLVDGDRARITGEATPPDVPPFRGTAEQARTRAAIADALAVRPLLTILLVLVGLRLLLAPSLPFYLTGGLIVVAALQCWWTLDDWTAHRRRAARARAQLEEMTGARPAYLALPVALAVAVCAYELWRRLA